MAVLYGIEQFRWTQLQDDGSADPSASAITSTKIQSMDIAPVYVDGNEATLRGGDDIVAIVKEDDKFLGVDLTINTATFEGLLKAAIVGGTASDDDDWTAPVDDTEMPYPGKLEVWVKNYTESDSESTQDGYILYTFNFCKGKLGAQNPADQSFATEQFIIRARRNDSDPSNIAAAVEMEVVESIT